MVKIEYDVDELVGDLLSKDGFFIDLVGCKEFTFWYLLRQLGIRSYVPVIGTTSFICEQTIKNIDKVINSNKQNVFILFDKAEKYFGVKIKYYTEEDTSFHAFIKKAIMNNKFVYALFDTSLNSLKSYEMDYNDQHGYALVGYDDTERAYYSILSTKVKYEDLDKMIQSGFNDNNSYKNVLYYFESFQRITINDLEAIHDELINDINMAVSHWEKEFLFFTEEMEAINQSTVLSIDKKKLFIEDRNMFYNMLMVGVHGNFIFKLRCIKEIYDIDTDELQNRYCENRKSALTLANMFRKSLIKINKGNEDYYNKTVSVISEKIYQVYIEEGKILLNDFCQLVDKVLNNKKGSDN